MRQYELIDIHSHIHDQAYDSDRLTIIEEMSSRDIATVTIGTDYETSVAAATLASQHENIYYTIGVHPCDDVHAQFDELEFKKLLGPKCFAVGECGLDYFYLKSNREKGSIINIDSEIDRQQQLFIDQIDFARENNLPLMLHGRPSHPDELDNPNGMDAYEDMLYILEQYYQPNQEANTRNGIVHFFVGDVAIAQRFLNIGFDFSLGGVITITDEYDDMIRSLPLGRIHVETDSPYVIPRIDNKKVAKRNAPIYIDIIIQRLSELKGVEENSLRATLLENFQNMFRRN